MRWAKKIVLLVFVLGCAVSALSYRYNYPIKIWNVAKGSQSVRHAAGERPDNIVLTPTADMRTMASITWRTAAQVPDGMVQFARADAESQAEFAERRAEQKKLYSRELDSNQSVSCYSALLTGLEPGLSYRYRVGSPSLNAWSDYRTFSTAPDNPASWSFVYFGDPQASAEDFGKALETVEERHPEVLFYMIGGDLVDKGWSRNLWDSLLASTSGVFARKPVVPALGNHDFGRYQAGSKIFSAYFSLPPRQRVGSGSELNYSFEYGGAYFIVVNAEEPQLAKQTAWLEAELQKAEAAGSAFKVVMCHFPVYNTSKKRSSNTAQKYWVPLFDKYGVDLMLTGHYHSYMRSKPLVGGKESPEKGLGTTYVMAVGCEKFYPFKELSVAAKQFGGVVTYQLVTLSRDADDLPVLEYKAYNLQGEILDEFVRP